MGCFVLKREQLHIVAIKDRDVRLAPADHLDDFASQV